MENMNDLRKDVQDTMKKAQYMAKEVAKDVKDDAKGAMNIMENKKDEMMNMIEEKKFVAEIKHQMKKENQN